jgi:Domain of Unknown Function (DUF1080)
MNNSIEDFGRRRFLKNAAKASATACAIGQLHGPVSLAATALHEKASREGYKSLFDGVSLKGWTPKARTANQTGVGMWKVADGVIVGGQDPVGVGAYLVSDEAFSDFELEIEAKPDWPADTGIYVRANALGSTGFQVNLDYRPHGTIGGYYGNGLGSFHAYAYGFTAEKNEAGRIVRLIPGKPSQPNDVGHLVTPDYVVPAEKLLSVWKLNDWNSFRIRAVGEVPYLTTWINGLKVSELDTAKMVTSGWDPKKVTELVGREGHIALEVHNNSAGDWLGTDRWAPGAVCRWRNIGIRVL